MHVYLIPLTNVTLTTPQHPHPVTAKWIHGSRDTSVGEASRDTSVGEASRDNSVTRIKVHKSHSWSTVDSLFRQITKPEDHIQGAWHGDALLLDVPESSPNPPISSQNTRRKMRTETNAAEAFRRLKARTPLPKEAVDRRLLSYRSCLKFLVTQKNSACVGMKSYHIRLPCEGNGLPSARLS